MSSVLCSHFSEAADLDLSKYLFTFQILSLSQVPECPVESERNPSKFPFQRECMVLHSHQQFAEMGSDGNHERLASLKKNPC